MDWRMSVDSLCRCRGRDFPTDCLEKGPVEQWDCFKRRLGKWNDIYLMQHENIPLMSPVAYRLEVYTSSFRIPGEEADLEKWLYWAFLSAYVSDSSSKRTQVRRPENWSYEWEFWISLIESEGTELEEFLNSFWNRYYFSETGYIWIGRREFLKELSAKRKHSYQRLIRNGFTYNRQRELSYIKRHWEYEKLFQQCNEETFDVLVSNPQGIKDLTDDDMWFLVRTEKAVYIWRYQDYY